MNNQIKTELLNAIDTEIFKGEINEFQAKDNCYSILKKHSCGFAEFIVQNFWIMSSNDLWYFKTDGNIDSGITTKQLFELYTKQLK